MSDIHDLEPTLSVSVRETFNIDSDLKVAAFARPCEFVPDVDTAYQFNTDVTLAILAGFAYNRRVMIQGLHGTGKSTHIEQVAARLNWPCIRLNLDGQISRLDLVGKDTIVLRDNKQVTEFQEGIIPWSLQRPVALIFDEYDAGRPDIMFVIQRILERDGKFTLLDQNKVINPNPHFRMFATSNTIGQGNLNGLYHGAQLLNHAQLDRWDIVTSLNYLSKQDEVNIIKARVPGFEDENLMNKMVTLAQLTRNGFAVGDLSTLMSPRTVISWAENYEIFKSIQTAFKLSFLNKCSEDEKPLVAEFFQRCFNEELDESYANSVNTSS
jgi:cobaltochelatase CobS